MTSTTATIACSALLLALTAASCSDDPASDNDAKANLCENAGKYSLECKPVLNIEDVNLATKYQSEYEVIRTQLEVGETVVWKFRVTNVGNGVLVLDTLGLESVSVPSPFTCALGNGKPCGDAVAQKLRPKASGDVLLFVIKYVQPDDSVDHEAVLRIAGGGKEPSIRFAAVEGVVSFSLSPSAIDFGFVPIGGNKEAAVKIYSTGTLPLAISGFSRDGLETTDLAVKLGDTTLPAGRGGELKSPVTIAPTENIALIGTWSPSGDLGLIGKLKLTANATGLEVPVVGEQSPTGRLCRPCAEDIDCQLPGKLGSRCILYGELGAFCGTACELSDSQSCPSGYVCLDSETVVPGEKSTQCVAKPEEGDEVGSCACSENAIALKSATFCYVVHHDKAGKLIGKCTGKRTCELSGLSDCVALPPSPEVCDGLDNDCDGSVDDQTCDDDNPCTKDICKVGSDGAPSGCLNEPVDGPCEDGNACTAQDSCLDGVCKAGDALACNDNNGCTKDLCNPAKGCVAEPDDSGTCNDKDPCTVDDYCKFGACQPGSSATCSDENVCTSDSCVPSKGCQHAPLDGITCDADGTKCTANDTCVSGQCKPGEKTKCDDNNSCTVDSCMDDTGLCAYKTLPENAQCNDGSICTSADTCVSGKCVGKLQSCDDGNICTQDVCNPVTGCSTAPTPGAPCDDSDKCTKADTCKGAVCAGLPAQASVTCDDGNSCTTDSCAPDKGCQHAANKAGCDDGNPCTVGDSCDATKCVAGKDVCSCKSNADCAGEEDGNLCNGTLICNKTSVPWTCQVDKATIVKCSADQTPQCKTSACEPKTGKCGLVAAKDGLDCDADGSLCTTSDNCQAGACQPGAAKDCNDNDVCTTDTCNPQTGACQYGAAKKGTPCDDGSVCTQKDGCVSGKCAGLKISCDDGNPCTTNNCDAKGGCIHAANASSCDDGNGCTVGDACKDKVCVAGTKKLCDDGKVCTVDECDSDSGACSADPKPMDGKTSDADGSNCTLGDSCSSGKCVVGQPAKCDDGNSCTLSGCDAKTGKCTFDSVAMDTKTCNADDSGCTVADACHKGVCVAGAKAACNKPVLACQSISCVSKSATSYTCAVISLGDTTPCSDGDNCTLGDVCKGGKCQPGASKTCPAQGLCLVGICSPKTGECSTASDNEGKACDDGTKCTNGDACKAGSCVGTAVTCNDNNVCTDDSCDKVKGCVSTNNSKPCDDNNACVKKEACAGGKCQGTQVGCDDNNVCTDDLCNKAKGCVHSPNTKPCPDGNACTTGELCSSGSCKTKPVKCDDGNVCTDSACDAAKGCVLTNNTKPCDDNNACVAKEACAGGKCKGIQVGCDDNNACTDDSCDKVKGCVYTPNTKPCPDGDACTVEELCSSGKCTTKPKKCDDGNLCTNDSCDKAKGCVHANNTASCDDSDKCTDKEQCKGGACVGIPISCDDSNGCTTDKCDSATGKCVHKAKPIGGTITLDGLNDYVAIPPLQVGVPMNDFTISIWAKLAKHNPGSGYRSYLVDTRGNGNFVHGAYMVIDKVAEGSKVSFGVDGISSGVAVATIADVVGKWHHYALARNGAKLTAYVDGKVVAASTLPKVNGLSVEGGARLGLFSQPKYSSPNYWFAGSFADFTIWKKGHDELEMQKLGTTPVDSKSKDLLVYYAFSEGKGDKVGDSSGNGHTGTLLGPVWSGSGPICQPGSVCGDGKLAAWEVCDDGNSANGDGCSSVCTAEVVKDCKTLLAKMPKLASGHYAIDPDEAGGAPAVKVYCDMKTAGGGWTLVFEPAAANTGSATGDGNVVKPFAGIDYTVTNAPLRAGSNEVMLALRDGGNAVVAQNWATFDLPKDWQTKSPFNYSKSNASIDVSVAGASKVSTDLYYGFSSWSTDKCGSWNANPYGPNGKICTTTTKTPAYQHWAREMAHNSCVHSTECCPDKATKCTDHLRFTIAVRKK